MIKEVTMYTVICDNCCKDVCENEQYSAWNCKDFVESIAKDCDWYCEHGDHYCRDCYEYDDDGNLIVKQLKP